MSTYKSKPVTVNRPAGQLFDRFSDLSFLQERMHELPAEELAKVGEVKFDSDSLTIVTPQMGEIKFSVLERVSPNKIVFGAAGSPIPITMTVTFTPHGEEETEVVSAIDIEIPAMLRPFIGPKLQQASDKFGELISQLSK